MFTHSLAILTSLTLMKFMTPMASGLNRHHVHGMSAPRMSHRIVVFFNDTDDDDDDDDGGGGGSGVDNDGLSYHVTVSVRSESESSGLLFLENLLEVKPMETLFYSTVPNQQIDFVWYRTSGIRCNIGVTKINIVSTYVSRLHGSRNTDDERPRKPRSPRATATTAKTTTTTTNCDDGDKVEMKNESRESGEVEIHDEQLPFQDRRLKTTTRPEKPFETTKNHSEENSTRSAGKLSDNVSSWTEENAYLADSNRLSTSTDYVKSIAIDASYDTKKGSQPHSGNMADKIPAKKQRPKKSSSDDTRNKKSQGKEYKSAQHDDDDDDDDTRFVLNKPNLGSDVNDRGVCCPRELTPSNPSTGVEKDDDDDEKRIFRHILSASCRSPLPDHYVLNLEIFSNISSDGHSDDDNDDDDDDGDDGDYLGGGDDDDDDDNDYGSEKGNRDSFHAKILPEPSSSSSSSSSSTSSSSLSSDMKLRRLLSTPCLSKHHGLPRPSTDQWLSETPNSVVCSVPPRRLLRNVFNVSETTFGTTGASRCRPPGHKSRNYCSKEDRLSSSCGKQKCPGQVYRLTIEPSFKRMITRGQHRCQVQKVLPETLYCSWYYVSVPALNFETPRLKFSIKAKDEDHFKGGSTKFDFFRIDHVTQLDLFPSQLTLLGTVAKDATAAGSLDSKKMIFHALRPQDHPQDHLQGQGQGQERDKDSSARPDFRPRRLSRDFQRVTLRFKGQPFVVSSSNWNRRMKSIPEEDVISENFQSKETGKAKHYLNKKLKDIKQELTMTPGMTSSTAVKRCYGDDVTDKMVPLYSDADESVPGKIEDDDDDDYDDDGDDANGRYSENNGFRVDPSFHVEKLEGDDDDCEVDDEDEADVNDDDDDDDDDDGKKDGDERSSKFKYLVRNNRSDPYLKISVEEGQSVLRWWFSRRGKGHLDKDNIYDVSLTSPTGGNSVSIGITGQHNSRKIVCPTFLALTVTDLILGLKMADYDVVMPCPSPWNVKFDVDISTSFHSSIPPNETSENPDHIHVVATTTNTGNSCRHGWMNESKHCKTNSSYLVTLSDAVTDKRRYYLSTFVVQPERRSINHNHNQHHHQQQPFWRPLATQNDDHSYSSDLYLKYFFVAFTSMLATLLNLSTPRHRCPGNRATEFIGDRTTRDVTGCDRCRCLQLRGKHGRGKMSELFCCVSLLVSVTSACLCFIEVRRSDGDSGVDSVRLRCKLNRILGQSIDHRQSNLQETHRRCEDHFQETFGKISKVIRDGIQSESSFKFHSNGTSRLLGEMADLFQRFASIYDRLLRKYRKKFFSKLKRNTLLWFPWMTGPPKFFPDVPLFHKTWQSSSNVVLHLTPLAATTTTTTTTTTSATTAIPRNVTDCHSRQFFTPPEQGGFGSVNRFFDVSDLGASLDSSDIFATDSHCHRYLETDKSFDFFRSPLAWISEKLNIFTLTSHRQFSLIAVVILDVVLSCWRCFLLSRKSQFGDDKVMTNQRSRCDSLKKKLREEKNCWQRRKYLPFLAFPGQMDGASSLSWVFETNFLQSFGRSVSTKCDLISESQPSSSAEIHYDHSLCSDASGVEINLAVKNRREAKSYLLPRFSGELRDNLKTRTCDKNDVCLGEVQEPSNFSDYHFHDRKPTGSTPAGVVILDVLDSRQCFKVATFGVVLLVGQLLDSFRQMASSPEIHKHRQSVSFTSAESCGVSQSNLPFFFGHSDFQHLKCLLSMARHDGVWEGHPVVPCPSIVPLAGDHHHGDAERYHGNSDRVGMKNSESSPDHWSMKWIFPSTLRHWAADALNVNVQLAPIILLVTDLVLVFKSRRNMRNVKRLRSAALDPADDEERSEVNDPFRRTFPPHGRKDTGRELQGIPENERTTTTSSLGPRSWEPRFSQGTVSLPADVERFPRGRTIMPGLKLKKFPNNWLLYEETKV